MTTILPALAGYIILSITMLWVARAGANGSLDVNGAIGVRTQQTRESPQAWKAAHRAFLPFATAVAVTCAVFVVALPLMYFAAFGQDNLGIMVVAGYAVVLGIIVAGGIKSNEVARENNEGQTA